MNNELRLPGPDKDGFRVHVLDCEGDVHIQFGVMVDHVPMNPQVAHDLAGAVYRVWNKIDPNGKLQAPLSDVTVSAHDGQVLLETPVETSQLILSPAQARMFCLTVMDVIAKIGKQAFKPEV